MKTLIIFDLKETLVASNKTLKVKPDEIKKFAKRADLVLYSIAQPWTYAVLAKYQKMFAEFKEILLVSEKKPIDLKRYMQMYGKVIVAGDDVNAEILFANNLGFKTVTVYAETDLNADVSAALMERTS